MSTEDLSQFVIDEAAKLDVPLRSLFDSIDKIISSDRFVLANTELPYLREVVRMAGKQALADKVKDQAKTDFNYARIQAGL